MASSESQAVGLTGSDAAFSSPQSFSLLCVNIGNILSLRRFGKLLHLIEQQRPHIVFLQETWLDASVEEIMIPGYYCIPEGRLDRIEGPRAGYGGVIAYARNDCHVVASVCASVVAERNWFVVHSQIGFCCWVIGIGFLTQPSRTLDLCETNWKV